MKELNKNSTIKCPECGEIGNPVDEIPRGIKNMGHVTGFLDFILFPFLYLIGYNADRYRTGVHLSKEKWFCSKCGWQIIKEDQDLERKIDKKKFFKQIIGFVGLMLVLYFVSLLFSYFVK
jgi:hypothetical protein